MITLSKTNERIKHLFKLDLRSLAFARVLLGILAFFDLATNFQDLDVFYTDNGILTRAILLESFTFNYKMSLLSLNGTYSFALILTLVGMLASIFLALGWRSRVATFVTWIVIISFQARFPEAHTSGGDMLLRIFLFWSFFLPMNARYSIDNALSENKIEKNEFLSIFSAAWVVQIMLLYILTFLYKWAPVYTKDFNAVYFILNLDFLTTPFGKWLGQFYTTTKFLSVTSYALEIIGPLLLFIPYKRDLFRGIAVVSFWCFHLGIGATLHLGNFVPICMIIWVGMIPALWWDMLAAKVSSTSIGARKLYYNMHSGFDRKLSFVTKELLFLDTTEVIPGTSESFMLDNENLKTSQLLLSSRFVAFRWLGKVLSSSWSMRLLEVTEAGEVGFLSPDSKSPRKTGPGRLYKTAELALDNIGHGQVKHAPNRAESLFGKFILTLVIAWNIEGYSVNRKWEISGPLDDIMFTFQINQGWSMFAPHPQRSDGYWIMEGTLDNGKKWDALNDKQVNFDRPEDMYETYPSFGWRKFLDNLQSERSEEYLRLMSRHLCRKWNTDHGGEESLKTFKLYFMQEWTHDPTGPKPSVEKIKLWNHTCY